MKMHMSDVEGRALHGLIEDAAGDIVVRLDAAGFVIHASANASRLGTLDTLRHAVECFDQARAEVIARLQNRRKSCLSSEVSRQLHVQVP